MSPGGAREAVEVEHRHNPVILPCAAAPRPRRQAARLDEREVALVGQDHVIEDVDAHDVAGIHHPRRSAPDRRGSASGRPTDGCERARWPRPTPRPPPGTPRADGRRCVSSDPTDTILIRITRCLVSSMTMPNCSTGRGAVLRQQVARRAVAGVISRGRSAAPRTSVRRPSSTAASTCAARAPADARAPDADRRTPAASGRAARRRASSRRLASASASRVARAAAEHERQQLVVAKRRRAEPLELFARPIVRRDDLSLRLYSDSLCVGRSCALACSLRAARARACARPPEQGNGSGAGRDRRRARRRRRSLRNNRVHGRDRRAQERQRRRRAARLPPGAQPRAREPRTCPERRARSRRDTRAPARRDRAQHGGSGCADGAGQHHDSRPPGRPARPPRASTRWPSPSPRVNEDVQKAGEAMKADDYVAARARAGWREGADRADHRRHRRSHHAGGPAPPQLSASSADASAPRSSGSITRRQSPARISKVYQPQGGLREAGIPASGMVYPLRAEPSTVRVARVEIAAAGQCRAARCASATSTSSGESASRTVSPFRICVHASRVERAVPLRRRRPWRRRCRSDW